MGSRARPPGVNQHLPLTPFVNLSRHFIILLPYLQSGGINYIIELLLGLSELGRGKSLNPGLAPLSVHWTPPSFGDFGQPPKAFAK